jgi:hypothetical protein
LFDATAFVSCLGVIGNPDLDVVSVVDLLVPYQRGGKIQLFGGGVVLVSATCAHHEADQQCS